MGSFAVIEFPPLFIAKFLRIESWASVWMPSCSNFLSKGLFMNFSKVSFHELFSEDFTRHSSKNPSKDNNLYGDKSSNNHEITEIGSECLSSLGNDVHKFILSCWFRMRDQKKTNN